MVTWQLLHDGLPHVVPAATSSQTPPAAQLPVLPQGGAALHWPAGAAVPAVTFAHVPSGEPVSAIAQARQVVLQAVLQRTPSAQNPLAHLIGGRAARPVGSGGPQVPPLFVRSQNLPTPQSPSAVQATQTMARSRRHAIASNQAPFAVRAQGACRAAVDGSLIRVLRSRPMQWVATQVPLPSHTTPPLSEQAVPSGASVVPQVRAVGSHALICRWSSDRAVGRLQACPHLPMPSQMAPPLSKHGVAASTSLVPQQPATHESAMHTVVCVGQSNTVAQLAPLPFPVVPPVPAVLLLEDELAVAVAPPAPLLLEDELAVAVAPPVPLVEAVAVVPPPVLESLAVVG